MIADPTPEMVLVVCLFLAGLVVWAGWLVWDHARDEERWAEKERSYLDRLDAKRAEIERLGGRWE